MRRGRWHSDSFARPPEWSLQLAALWLFPPAVLMILPEMTSHAVFRAGIIVWMAFFFAPGEAGDRSIVAVLKLKIQIRPHRGLGAIAAMGIRSLRCCRALRAGCSRTCVIRDTKLEVSTRVLSAIQFQRHFA